jgi:hypothetical protein
MPATGVAPGPVNVNVASLIVAGFIASLNVAVMTCESGTSPAAFAGAVATTAGPRTEAGCPAHPAIRPVIRSAKAEIA